MQAQSEDGTVKTALRSGKKLFPWRRIATRSLGRQQRNKFPHSTHPRAWLAQGKAYLGECYVGGTLAVGFGGTIWSAVREGEPVVTKKLHRDEGNELLKKVLLGLLIPSSPYLGFCANALG